jgi:hypothetical protein
MKQYGQKGAENQENRDVNSVSSLFEKADLQWLREHVSDADGFELLAVEIYYFKEESGHYNCREHT